MNTENWFQKNQLLSLSAAVAVFVPPAAFLTVNFRAEHPVFQAVDMAFAVFMGVVLALNVVVWYYVLRGARPELPAAECTPAARSYESTGLVRATPPARTQISELTPVIMHQLLSLSAAADLVHAAPLCGLDSTFDDLPRNLDRNPVRNPGRSDDLQN